MPREANGSSGSKPGLLFFLYSVEVVERAYIILHSKPNVYQYILSLVYKTNLDLSTHENLLCENMPYLSCLVVFSFFFLRLGVL